MYEVWHANVYSSRDMSHGIVTPPFTHIGENMQLSKNLETVSTSSLTILIN